MNRLHHWLCRSSRWRQTLGERVPWALANIELGNNVLEIGPGPGLTTDLLRLSAKHPTALEPDRQLADSLRVRFSGSNVEVVRGDATTMPFPGAQFTAGVRLPFSNWAAPSVRGLWYLGLWRWRESCGMLLKTTESCGHRLQQGNSREHSQEGIFLLTCAFCGACLIVNHYVQRYR